VCVLFVGALSGGCGRPASDKAGSPAAGEPKNPLPSFLAGTWQMREGVWAIVIEPNGTVGSAFIPLEVWVRPHQTTRLEMVDGNFSTFTGGDFLAEYNPANRELSVYIEVRKFNVRVFDVRTGGSTVDRFIGPVSEDGKVWRPDWINVFDYGPDLPQGEDTIAPALCVFDKIEEKQQPTDGQKPPG